MPELETGLIPEGDPEPVEQSGEQVLDEAVGPSASAANIETWVDLIEEIESGRIYTRPGSPERV